MVSTLKCDSKEVVMRFDAEEFYTQLKDDSEQVRVRYDDLVAVQRYEKDSLIHYIKRHQDFTWTKEVLKLSEGPENHLYDECLTQLEEHFTMVTQCRPKKLLVLINPIAGQGQSRKLYDNVVSPLFELTGIKCDVIVSERKKHLIQVAEHYDFSTVNGCVLFGGDGTFTEVVNVLLKKRQVEEGIDVNDETVEIKPTSLPVMLMPTGSGCVASMFSTVCLDVLTSALHVIRGVTKHINIAGFYSGNRLMTYCGILAGHGIGADLFEVADTRGRWLGKSRYRAFSLMYLVRTPRVFHVEMTVFTKEEKDGKISEKKETYQSDSIMVMNWAFNIADEERSVIVAQDSQICCLFFRPTGRWTIATYLANTLFNDKRFHMFERDFIDIYRGNKMHIKIINPPGISTSDEIANRTVSLDGEIYECPDSEFLLKMFENVVKVYSSI